MRFSSKSECVVLKDRAQSRAPPTTANYLREGDAPRTLERHPRSHGSNGKVVWQTGIGDDADHFN